MSGAEPQAGQRHWEAKRRGAAHQEARLCRPATCQPPRTHGYHAFQREHVVPIAWQGPRPNGGKRLLAFPRELSKITCPAPPHLMGNRVNLLGFSRSKSSSSSVLLEATSAEGSATSAGPASQADVRQHVPSGMHGSSTRPVDPLVVASGCSRSWSASCPRCTAPSVSEPSAAVAAACACPRDALLVARWPPAFRKTSPGDAARFGVEACSAPGDASPPQGTLINAASVFSGVCGECLLGGEAGGEECAPSLSELVEAASDAQ